MQRSPPEGIFTNTAADLFYHKYFSAGRGKGGRSLIFPAKWLIIQKGTVGLLKAENWAACSTLK
jgi:hypothetical protein